MADPYLDYMLDHMRIIYRLRMHSGSHHRDTPPPFYGAEDFLLRFGRAWPAPKLPRKLTGFKRGRMGHCFHNAYALVDAQPHRFRYCEGYAMKIIPVIHAWVIDVDGNVVDPTWKQQEDSRYFGVIYNFDYVRKAVSEAKHYTSMLDNPFSGYPLLSGKHRASDAISPDMNLYLDGRAV